jgi:hypothetical protein
MRYTVGIIPYYARFFKQNWAFLLIFWHEGMEGKSNIKNQKAKMWNPPAARDWEWGARGQYRIYTGGSEHVLALDEDGNVWAWGLNDWRQLGNGGECDPDFDGNAKFTPARVKTGHDTPLTDIVYIDAGFWHSLAIDKYGVIWVWGMNMNGQLGLGYYSNLLREYYATPMSLP